MPILHVTDDPRSPRLFYLDSGAPHGSTTYTTIFLIHGHTFHSHIFERLLPLAPQYNLRIVPVNRRDYPGSTPFSAEELELIKNGDAPAKWEFLKERARELAFFINKFIQLNSIPVANGADGGVSIAGWSLGNLLGLSLVAFAGHLPRELIESLEPYIRNLITYDCPYHVLGLPSPPKAYHPLSVSTISPEDRIRLFSSWVSGYFRHPGLATRNPDGLEYVKPSTHRPATDTTFTEDDKARTMDHTPGPRSDNAPFFIDVPRMMDQLRDDVFFPNVVEWPKVTVKLAWAEESVWSTVYGYWKLEEYMAEMTAKKPDNWHRSLEKVVSIPAANHFVHWDDPEKLLQVFVDLCSIE